MRSSKITFEKHVVSKMSTYRLAFQKNCVVKKFHFSFKCFILLMTPKCFFVVEISKLNPCKFCKNGLNICI